MRKKKTWFRLLVYGEDKIIPTILVSRVGEQFTFYCRYCQRGHYHGAKEGHRVAHCEPGVGYYRTGYFLKEESK